MTNYDIPYDLLIMFMYLFGFVGLIGITYLIYLIPPVKRFFDSMDN